MSMFFEKLNNPIKYLALKGGVLNPFGTNKNSVTVTAIIKGMLFRRKLPKPFYA